ncbi:hypothetical protein AV530_014287 [Patagioenas fasciata monilis]|uniref:Uncharacterized protein n=1 Tax=Patagioenas fasciata monilis TaxID=372326 RepID=A0A1V4KBI6_PATFA|nr:hypothetical protein AV530_014287 [Patagioenas fasciata monilis]
MHTSFTPQLRDMPHLHTLYPGIKILPKDTLDSSEYSTLLTAEVTSKEELNLEMEAHIAKRAAESQPFRPSSESQGTSKKAK